MSTESKSVCTLLLILFNIQALITQSPPFFAWQHSLWTKHNELRSKIALGKINSQPFSTNMEHILYESALETIALNHALQCNYTHNKALNHQVKQISNQLSFKFSAFDQFGENIAYDSIGPLLDSDNLQRIIQQQWFEHQYYNYHNNQCISNVTDCSSYQNLLWAKTRYMACGVSICAELYLPHEDKTISNAAFIVCNYWPSFDKDELPIYNTIPINNPNDIPSNLCTDCAVDRTQCTHGLCSGCPAPKYNFCQDGLIGTVCADSKDKCNTDPIIRSYCTYTCTCSADDWIPDAPCDDLYLYVPTQTPTSNPISDDCHRLGWYDVTELESDSNIKCPDGYILPNTNGYIEFIIDNCLIGDDINTLNQVSGPYKPYGIAMDWMQYDIGCEWNTEYDQGVIPTHTGVKCGDGKQLFICVFDRITTTMFTIPPLDTEAPTIITTSSEPTSANPTTMQPSTHRPSWSPSDKPTEEPTQVDDTASPTSAPTEGPTFSPTPVPTNEPSDVPTISPITNAPTTYNPTTATPTVEPIVEVEYEPFRMYLLFPESLSSVQVENQLNNRNSRRLSAVHVREMMDNDKDVELYPLHMAHKSLEMEKDNNGYGYEFNLSQKVMNENVMVGLSQIIYTIDVNENLCGLDMDELDGTLIEFKFFKKYKDEWKVIESIGYNVKFSDDYIEKRWMDIIIDVDDYKLMFDVSYMFVIDVSLLMDNCMDLSHVIYAKSFGNFNVEKNNFMVNGLKSVELLNGNQVNHYRYWMRMSMKFN